jgi:hypothetical protein
MKIGQKSKKKKKPKGLKKFKRNSITAPEKKSKKVFKKSNKVKKVRLFALDSWMLSKGPATVLKGTEGTLKVLKVH